MDAADRGHAKLLPPAPVLVVLFGLLVFVPLASWILVSGRDWGYGDTPAAALDTSYFWAVLLLRLGGALFLAILLLFCRNPASVWITLTSVWLAGPPFQWLLTGVQLLALSGAQRSLPPFHSACWWCRASGLPS